MTSVFRITAVQAPAREPGVDLAIFATDVGEQLVLEPATQMLVYPELHLFYASATDPQDKTEQLRAAAITLDGDEVAALRAIARENGIWLLPGSVVERSSTGDIFNTAIVINPSGDLVASYRKMFPWRPYEPFTAGTDFTVFDIDDVGRFGLSICYDSWFPEVSRSLAWMGADIVINLVMTTTPDRAQELVLARANSIVNQTFTVCVNTAGPVGVGDSLIVGPEGEVLTELTGAGAGRLTLDFSKERVEFVRENGTASSNRMWDQFLPADEPLALPIYQGRIDPRTWKPKSHTQHKGENA
ncbi:MAG: hypothetical protein RLZZ441_563 [Actinomycetota bacterium]